MSASPTDVGYTIADHTQGTPEQRLADLVSRQFGVSISAERMRSFVCSKWNVLTVLAHATHEKSKRSQKRALYRERQS